MAEGSVVIQLFAIFGLVMLVVPILLLLFGWGNITRYLAKRKQRRLTSLVNYHARLLRVINHLLTRADHIDQLSKFYAGEAGDKWAADLADACEKLVALTDSTKLIESSLQSKDTRTTEETLLRCIRISHHILTRLTILERQLGGSSGTFRVKGKQVDKMQDKMQ